MKYFKELFLIKNFIAYKFLSLIIHSNHSSPHFTPLFCVHVPSIPDPLTLYFSFRKKDRPSKVFKSSNRTKEYTIRQRTSLISRLVKLAQNEEKNLKSMQKRQRYTMQERGRNLPMESRKECWVPYDYSNIR